MRSILRSSILRDLILFIVAFGLVVFYVQTTEGNFPLDDSWIHQVYGRNLAENGEWAFIPGEPSAASTAPLYTVLLAAGYVLNVDYIAWTHLLGALALGFAAVFAARLADNWRPANAPLVGLIVGLALLTTWHLVWAAASGMETMLFAMFTILIVYVTNLQLPFQNRRGVAAAFGLAAALMTLTRPEGIVLAGLCGLVIAASGYKSPRKLYPWVFIAGFVFLLVMLPYLLLNLNLTGGLLPATAQAKYIQHRPLLEAPLTTRISGLLLPPLVGGQLLLFPGIFLISVMALMKKRWIELIPVLWVIILVLLYALRLPATYQHGRYMMPLLPLWVLGGVIGLHDVWQIAQESIIGRVLTRSLALSIAATALYFTFALGANAYRVDVQIIEDEMVAPAKWINANISPDNLLAVHDIGAVGYFAARPILDIAGLVEKQVVPVIGDAAGLWALLAERNAAYLMAFPDQIPGQNPNDPRLCPLFQSDGRTALDAGGEKMTIYRIIWEEECANM